MPNLIEWLGELLYGVPQRRIDGGSRPKPKPKHLDKPSRQWQPPTKAQPQPTALSAAAAGSRLAAPGLASGPAPVKSPAPPTGLVTRLHTQLFSIARFPTLKGWLFCLHVA